jgi:PAS domain S-box-containing protein
MKSIIIAGILLLSHNYYSGTTALKASVESSESVPSKSPRPAKVLNVAIDRGAAPMEFVYEGRPKGFNVDLIRACAELSGYELKFHFLPWSDVLKAVKTGGIDIMFALDTPERRKEFIFSKPILEITWRIFVNKETYGVSSLEDLHDHTVAVVKGFASHIYLLEKEAPCHIVATESVAEALKLLESGEVYAFFGQYHLARYYLLERGYENIKVIGDVIDVKPFSMAMGPDKIRILDEVNRSLDTLHSSGEYRRIYEKWYGGGSEGGFAVIKKIVPALLGLITAVLLLGLWTYLLRRKVRQKTRELSENLAGFQKFTERAPFPVVIVSPAGKFEYVNPEYSEIFGYTLLEIPDTETWFNTVYPDSGYRESVKQEWINHITNSIDIKNEPMIFYPVNRSGVKLNVAFRLINLDDGRAITIMEDIGDRIELEAARLRKQQIESISLLAGGLAHDFNNILMNLMGYINLIQMEESLSETGRENLARMESSIERAAAITGRIMTFAKGGHPLKKIQRVEPLITEAVNFVLHGSSCAAETFFAPDVPPLAIDPVQIYQSFSNLFINACQAMPEGGAITIRTSVKEITKSGNESSEGLQLESGNYLTVDIYDTGRGIDYEDQKKIFMPYFTTRENGTGLGLTTAYSIIQRHGGTLTFSSEPGRGTLFTVYLPIGDHKAEEAEIEAELDDVRYSMEAIVMDDEESILFILKKMLQRMGFTVTAVTDGDMLVDEYIRAYNEGRRYGLVITDLTIPGRTGGIEAMRRLREFDKDVCAVVSSGYSNEHAALSTSEHGFRAILQKPYTFSVLRRTIHSILDRGKQLS